MIELTPQRRRELRAQAHALHPVVSVGQHGLTPHVLHEIDIALGAHGLVKVRVFSEDRGQRETMLAQIAGELGAAPVQHLGKVLILWRPPEEASEKPAPRPTAKPRKERGATDAKRPSKNPAPREPRASHVARRRTPGSASTAGARTGTSSRSRRDSTPAKRPPRNADDAQATDERRRRRVPPVPASVAGKRPRESAFGARGAEAPAPQVRRRASSSPATDRAPTGKSAPSPRRRRRAG